MALHTVILITRPRCRAPHGHSTLIRPSVALADPTMRQVAESAAGLHGSGRRRRDSGVPRRPPAPHGRSQAWHMQRRPDTPVASAAPSGRRAGREAVRRERGGCAAGRAARAPGGAGRRAHGRGRRARGRRRPRGAPAAPAGRGHGCARSAMRDGWPGSADGHSVTSGRGRAGAWRGSRAVSALAMPGSGAPWLAGCLVWRRGRDHGQRVSLARLFLGLVAVGVIAAGALQAPAVTTRGRQGGRARRGPRGAGRAAVQGAGAAGGGQRGRRAARGRGRRAGGPGARRARACPSQAVTRCPESVLLGGPEREHGPGMRSLGLRAA